MLDKNRVLVVDRDTLTAVRLYLALPAGDVVDWDHSVSQLDDIGENWSVYELVDDEVGDCLAAAPESAIRDVVVTVPDGYYPDGSSRPCREAVVLQVRGNMADVRFCDNDERATVTMTAFMQGRAA